MPPKHQVGSSNLPGPTIVPRSGPGTWVTQRTDYMGNTFGPNGLSSGSSTRVSRSKYPKIIVNKTHEPDALMNPFAADGLAGVPRQTIVRARATNKDPVAQNSEGRGFAVWTMKLPKASRHTDSGRTT
jgi:hypothetical protein